MKQNLRARAADALRRGEQLPGLEDEGVVALPPVVLRPPAARVSPGPVRAGGGWARVLPGLPYISSLKYLDRR